MSEPRDQPVQQPPQPGQNLSGFPEVNLDAFMTLYRTHQVAMNPWFFDAVPGRGRFNLRAPRGTCYLASSRGAAARELIGPAMAKQGFVTSSLLKGRMVSTLRLPRLVRAANLAEDGMFLWFQPASSGASRTDGRATVNRRLLEG